MHLSVCSGAIDIVHQLKDEPVCVNTEHFFYQIVSMKIFLHLHLTNLNFSLNKVAQYTLL